MKFKISVCIIFLLTSAFILFAINFSGVIYAQAENMSATERQYMYEEVVLINEYRVSNGLLPLKINDNLTNAAYWHAIDMVNNNYNSHTDSLGRNGGTRFEAFGYNWNLWAENIAFASTGTPSTMFSLWQNSSTHNANMLESGAREIGMGPAINRGSTDKWSSAFGRTSSTYPVIINLEAQSTNSAEVTLYSHGNNGDTVRFSNDNANWSDWQNYTTSSIAWTLDTSTTNATKTVYYQLDSNGNIFSASDEIEYQIPNTVKIFRFFNSQNGAHLYTIDVGERDTIINTLGNTWTYEGEKYSVYDSGQPNTVPVYRFFNSQNGSHFYTTSEIERDQVASTASWMEFEGVKFYVHETEQPSSTPVYRFFNTQNGAHLYTDNDSERNMIESSLSQFQSEGIKYYVL